MFRQTTELVDELLASSHRVRVRAECWRGQQFLGSAPLVGGTLTEQADQFVAQVVDLDVSALDDTGGSWIPSKPTDALNVFGSRFFLSYDLGRADASTWLPVGLGWFIVDEWEDGRDGSLSVSALDVRDSLRTAKLLSPSVPRPNATFRSELTALVGGRVPLNLDAAPTNRTVPSGMAWSESRTEAIDELLKAWPARHELDADGTMIVLPDQLDSAPADVTLTEGVGGTVVKQRRSGTRDGLYNVVVARGEDNGSGALPVTGYAADRDPASPTSVDGPMGELVTFFSSPLLGTRAAANAAAQTILKRSLRTAEVIPVECLPDPRIGSNTRVDLAHADGTTTRTVVLTSKLPLTGDGGAQSLTLGVIQ